MTTQETDHLRFADHDWDIVEWVGDAAAAVPSDEALGFATQMETTANYRGRINTLAVSADNQLMLTSMRVCLADDSRQAVPGGARVEPLTSGPWAGQSVCFVFDHLPLPVTGELLIGRDAAGPAEPGQEPIEVYAAAMCLRFDSGQLVSSETKESDNVDAGGFI